MKEVYDNSILSQPKECDLMSSAATLKNVLSVLEPFNIVQVTINDTLVYSRMPDCLGSAEVFYNTLESYTRVKDDLIFVVYHIQITPQFGNQSRVYIEGDWESYVG